jgi:hypothetical protein
MIKEKLQPFDLEKTLFPKGVCVTSQGIYDEEFVSIYFRTDDILKRRPYTMSPCLRFDGIKVAKMDVLFTAHPKVF